MRHFWSHPWPILLNTTTNSTQCDQDPVKVILKLVDILPKGQLLRTHHDIIHLAQEVSCPM
jgi:hypothetical protein